MVWSHWSATTMRQPACGALRPMDYHPREIDALVGGGHEIWVGTAAGLRTGDVSGLHSVEHRRDSKPIKFIQIADITKSDVYRFE